MRSAVNLRSRLFSAGAFGLAGASLSLVAWVLVAGADTHPLVMSAVGSAGLAGPLLGLLASGRLLRTGRYAVVGCTAGVAFHPLTWTLFVLWARCSAWVSGREPAGLFLNDLGSVIPWSVGSLGFGFVSVPVFVAAAWLVARTHGPLEPGSS